MPDDPGYQFSRIQWLRRSDKITEAAHELLAAPREPERLVDPDQWWVERRAVGGRKVDRGRVQLARAAAHRPVQRPPVQVPAQPDDAALAHPLSAPLIGGRPHRAREASRVELWPNRKLHRCQITRPGRQVAPERPQRPAGRPAGTRRYSSRDPACSGSSAASCGSATQAENTGTPCHSPGWPSWPGSTATAATA